MWVRRVVDEEASRTNLLKEVKADGGVCPEDNAFNGRSTKNIKLKFGFHAASTLLPTISVSTDGVKEDLFFSVSWVGGHLVRNRNQSEAQRAQKGVANVTHVKVLLPVQTVPQQLTRFEKRHMFLIDVHRFTCPGIATDP